MNRADASERFPFGKLLGAVLVAALLYAAAYDECVRRPRVAFHWQAWPYYALGEHNWCGVGEYRLPERSAEIFFFPANWIDRKLHPKKWAEKRPFAE
ncbi:MAG TPA: hypothetical protein VFG04_20940 [Planctomycetaceae bacterium]|jgi:hypothetical protein|nr:hypothetical protein [Planctomycetaceae bacterium]